jgi:hypothetical protein
MSQITDYFKYSDSTFIIYVSVDCESFTVLNEPGQLSQYSVQLRTGRPGDRGSMPGTGERFFL